MTAARIQITSEEQALAVLAQVQELASLPPPAFVDEAFPKQAAFIKAKSYRKGLKCTRRAGKSMAFGRILYQEAYNFPGCSCVYIGLTKDTSRKIMWKDVMKRLNRDLKLGATHNETSLTTKLPNGSEIYLTGMDAGEEEMEKVLGGKIRVAIIDEAGSFRVDLKKLVYENLEPALADYDGYVCIGGTPTSFTKGLFFDVTKDEKKSGPREAGWDVFEWNTFDNPYMAENWGKRLERLKETNPRIEETPAFRRMYLGEWVTDEKDLCYKFNAERNTCQELPNQAYAYVLGVDLGFSPDPSAFVICAYSAIDRSLYIVETHKAIGMTVSDVADRIRYYTRKYTLQRIVIDNAAKQTVEELRQRHALPLEAAEKQGKAEFIEIMNSDMLQGLVKLLYPACQALGDEWLGLIWDKKAWEEKGKREEHPGCDNHLADAALYAWRHCYQYLSRPVVKDTRTETEKIDEWEEREAERLEHSKARPFWERDNEW